MPITHSPPENADGALEMPATEKRRLGLDDQRSWVVLDEYNMDAWPDDLRHLPGQPGNFAYGRISDGLLKKIIAGIKYNRDQGRLRKIPRGA